MKKTIELSNVFKDIEEDIERNKDEQINNLIDKFTVDLYNLQEEKGELSLQDILLHLKMFSIGMKKIR
ncbi:MAG: hypothetical protein ACI35O_09030 [Bacillaceae bacterium]